MFYSSLPCDVAKSLNDARMKYGVEAFTFDELQECWKDYTRDRRYKLWFCAASRHSYIMRVGCTEIYVVFMKDGIYARIFDDFTKYQHLNCWKIEYVGNYTPHTHEWTWHYTQHWQGEVRI